MKLVSDVGQQSDLTGALDSGGQVTLMGCAGTGGTAGQDLAALGQVTAEIFLGWARTGTSISSATVSMVSVFPQPARKSAASIAIKTRFFTKIPSRKVYP